MIPLIVVGTGKHHANYCLVFFIYYHIIYYQYAQKTIKICAICTLKSSE